MSQVIISAEKRENKGKSLAKKMRREGKIPGILYGAEADPQEIAVDNIELGRLLRKDHSIINVKVDGNDQQAVIKEVQNHPLTGIILHIDFMRVSAGQEIKVTVPIHLVGEAIGSKMGGVFSSSKTDLEIAVLPRYMPDNVEVDITNLDIGDAFRVKDLKLENIKILDDEDEMICQVFIPRKEEEPEEIEGLEDEEEMAEPEVITARDDDEKESE